MTSIHTAHCQVGTDPKVTEVTNYNHENVRHISSFAYHHQALRSPPPLTSSVWVHQIHVLVFYTLRRSYNKRYYTLHSHNSSSDYHLYIWVSVRDDHPGSSASLNNIRMIPLVGPWWWTTMLPRVIQIWNASKMMRICMISDNRYSWVGIYSLVQLCGDWFFWRKKILKLSFLWELSEWNCGKIISSLVNTKIALFTSL